MNCNVVVVGCGVAGLSAAVTAQQAGARVAVLEHAPFEDRGGDSRRKQSFWRMAAEDEVAPGLEERLADNAAIHPDRSIIQDAMRDYESWPSVPRGVGMVAPNLITAFVREVPETLRWLCIFGVKLDVLPLYFLGGIGKISDEWNGHTPANRRGGTTCERAAPPKYAKTKPGTKTSRMIGAIDAATPHAKVPIPCFQDGQPRSTHQVTLRGRRGLL